jgi:AcrR family transcriptional regulator
VKRKAKKTATRRSPIQKRAQITVDAMLDAAIRLLKKSGGSSITTNRIAETAGVSIGSVYQYFPNKQAIFIALHERHIDQVDQVIQRRIAESTDASLEGLLMSLIDGIVEIHAADPELSELLHSEVPHRAVGTRDFSVRLHKVFRSALAPHAREFGSKTDLDMRTFVVTNMIDALGHAIVLRRPQGVSLSRAKAELLRSALAYLQS